MAKFPNVLRQALRGAFPLGFGQKVKGQGKRIGCLRVGGKAAIRRNEFLLKCGLDLFQQSSIGRRVLRFTEDLRSLLKQGRGPREVGRLDQVLVRGSARIARIGGGESQPITKVVTAAPDVAIARFAPHVFHPGFHAWVLFLQNAAITVGEIHRPRHDG